MLTVTQHKKRNIVENVAAGGGLLLWTGAWFLSHVSPLVQFAASIIGLVLLYWSMRKKRAETLKIEKEIEQKNPNTPEHGSNRRT